jgi:hypothetical protein
MLTGDGRRVGPLMMDSDDYIAPDTKHYALTLAADYADGVVLNLSVIVSDQMPATRAIKILNAAIEELVETEAIDLGVAIVDD